MIAVITCQCRIGSDTAVREIALSGAAFRRILQNRGIDLTRGGASLAEAARQRQIPLAPLLEELQAVPASVPGNCRLPDWRHTGTRELVDFLQTKHHPYLKSEPYFLDTLFRKVLERNRGEWSRRFRLYRDWRDLSAALATHCELEERELFPRLAAGESGWTAARTAADLTGEHRYFLEQMDRLRRRSDMLENSRNDPALALLTESLTAYLDACEEHFFWEDCLLYPRLADVILRRGLPA